MIQLLTSIGLAAMPFFIWHGMDSRLPKEALGLFLALSIGLYAIYSGQLKRFNNPWYLLLLLFLPISLWLAPKLGNFTMAYFPNETSMKFVTKNPKMIFTNYWGFKPILYIYILSLMSFSLASLRLYLRDLRIFLKIMFWCGLLTALYIFIQAVLPDQFQKIATISQNRDINNLTAPTLVGFMGNATIVSQYLGMTVPFALYFRRYICAAVIIGAIFMTQSLVSIAAVVITTALWFCLKSRLAIILSFVLICVGIVGVEVKYFENPEAFTKTLANESNGRFSLYPDIIREWQTPQREGGRTYTMTGLGAGSFPYIYSEKNKSWFQQAHCDYLEILFNTGLIGLFLFLGANIYMLRKAMEDYYYKFDYQKAAIGALVCSYANVMICAMGSLPLQIPTTIFYLMIIVGLLHNPSIVKEMENEPN